MPNPRYVSQTDPRAPFVGLIDYRRLLAHPANSLRSSITADPQQPRPARPAREARSSRAAT